MKHTETPWIWVVNPTAKEVRLVARNGWGEDILRPARWGMQGAQLQWNVGGFYRDTMDLFKPVPGREHHKKWYGTIDHPDANFIVQAVNSHEALVEACKAAHMFIKNGIDFGFIRMPDDDCPDPAKDVPGIVAAALAMAGVKP